MRSNPKPLMFAVAVVAIAVVLFIALKPGESADSGKQANTATTGVTGVTGATGSTGATGTTEPKPVPVPAKVPTVVFKNEKPVGGVLGIEVDKGERIKFKVKSDVADEVHVHGFDISRDVAAGGTVSLDFPADITGIYEAEMEHHGVQIVELQIDP